MPNGAASSATPTHGVLHEHLTGKKVCAVSDDAATSEAGRSTGTEDRRQLARAVAEQVVRFGPAGGVFGYGAATQSGWMVLAGLGYAVLLTVLEPVREVLMVAAPEIGTALGSTMSELLRRRALPPCDLCSMQHSVVCQQQAREEPLAPNHS